MKYNVNPIKPIVSKSAHRVFHKAIRIYTGGLILGINTLYRVFRFFKLFGKEVSCGGAGPYSGTFVTAVGNWDPVSKTDRAK